VKIVSVSLKPTHFIHDLLDWYDFFKRPLPWRLDPGILLEDRLYRTWISEIMSQQSTLKTVLPRYLKWMQEFPTFKSLKNASIKELESLWSGLGYYSRVRNIFKIAQSISELSDLQNSSQWFSQPGIGSYTAHAIGAIVYDEAVVPVDGNVMRFMARLLKIEDPLNSSTDRSKIEQHLAYLVLGVPVGRRGDFAQALIEYGSQMCRPRNQPQCLKCPFIDDCQSFAQKKVDQIPRPRNRLNVEQRDIFFLFFRKPDSPKFVLVREIPEGFPLAGQWEIPWFGAGGWLGLRGPKTDRLDDDFKYLNLNDFTRRGMARVGPIKHQIMHFALSGYVLEAGDWSDPLPKGYRFIDVNVEGVKSFTISTHTRKVLQKTRSMV
jgi:A/G-specific adenine glycosylase